MIEPSTTAGVSEALRWAARDKQRVLVRGAGTKLGWGPPQPPAHMELSTLKLNRVVAHRHGDLTATIQCGARLADVNRELARHGQWIPLDPPFGDRATIGGIVATNDSGPRRHRFGAPRDLIIGVDIVRTDGVSAKAGGIVVKNVAGYDLARLMTGSFGSLAVITSATFKLFPIPSASRTVVIDGPLAQLCQMAGTIASSQLTPTAIEVQASARGPARLLVRFESIQAAAENQAQETAQLGPSSIASAGDEDTLWAAHDARVWDRGGAVIKLTVVPTEMAATLAWIANELADVDYDVTGRAGVGVLLVRVEAVVAKQAAFVRALRARIAPGRGGAVIVRGSEDLRRESGAWGEIGSSAAVMRAIKAQFDPDGILADVWSARL
ncbi:MAG TPA: FAD-binding oxidoreductase [Vicinamibacterales bacterium]|nr:FAD-binding oxidoreductase [Vicinamibacterales bacterium]